MKNSYSLQLFTLADVTKVSMEKALSEAARLGYEQVEFAGFCGHSAEQIREWLLKYGLKVSSAHVPLPEIRDHFAETVRFHQTIGNQNLIMPMEDLNSQEKLDQFVPDTAAVGEKLSAVGINLGYHNHLHEFHPNVDGSMIYDQITARTHVFLEVDVGWVNAAGGEPMEILKQWEKRIRFIHLRDSVPYSGKVTGTPMLEVYADVFKNNIGKPLGQGNAPIGEAYAMAVKNNWQMVIECEAKVPDGITAAALCMEQLKGLEAR